MEVLYSKRTIIIFVYYVGFFSSIFLTNTSIFVAISEEDGELLDGQVKSPFGSSFRTFDATDYSNIGKLEGHFIQI